ncbi:MAG: hypothetical protein ACLSHC_05165 [Bilophila wadsworthia]
MGLKDTLDDTARCPPNGSAMRTRMSRRRSPSATACAMPSYSRGLHAAKELPVPTGLVNLGGSIKLRALHRRHGRIRTVLRVS